MATIKMTFTVKCSQDMADQIERIFGSGLSELSLDEMMTDLAEFSSDMRYMAGDFEVDITE